MNFKLDLLDEEFNNLNLSVFYQNITKRIVSNDSNFDDDVFQSVVFQYGY